MNLLNQIGEQIRELFQSMTPSARIMAGLMFGVILVGAGWLLSGESSSEMTYLFGGKSFTDAELELWEATFGDAKLRAYERVGNRIRVPAANKDEYLRALNSANALPMQWGGYVDKALNGGSPFDSNKMIDAKLEAAREAELASIIRQSPGIEQASVQYDERREGFARDIDRVCSISVIGTGGQPIPRNTLRTIQMQAQHFFAGLAADKITVTDIGSNQSYRASTGPGGNMDENPMLLAAKSWNNYYMDKLRAVLSNYGNIKLDVNVDIDPTVKQQTEKLSYDASPVTVQSSSSRRDEENSKQPPGGPPGVGTNANVGNTPQSLSSASNSQKSTVKDSEESERRLAGQEVVVTDTAGLVPKQVRVTVGIPESYLRDVHTRSYLLANPDKTGEDVPAMTDVEKTRLEEEVKLAVRAAVDGIPVGKRDGENNDPYVSVYMFPDLPLPPIPEPALADTALAWLSESWSTLALLTVVLASLGMTFSWVKGQPAPESDQSFAEGFGLKIPEIADEIDLSEGVDENGDPIVSSGETGGESGAKAGLDVQGEDLMEDLNGLINENPDAAVNLLKTWIGDAA